MRVYKIKKYLRLYRGVEETKKIDETVFECRKLTAVGIMDDHRRTDFFEFLSEVFRMNGIQILGGQIATLILVCLLNGVVDDFPRMIPVFIPFFVMAALPMLYRAELSRMNEIELATKNSYAQLQLARLIIIGASDIVCFTVLLLIESAVLKGSMGIVNLILYVLVPYMLCVTIMLRLMRSGKRDFYASIRLTVLVSFLWGIIALFKPGLYQASAVSIWMISFITFAIFFALEIKHLIINVKEGKTYGFVS
ncbi:MAG: hypothetical protein K6D96_02285 [Acetatifactor sp.]|nr:hypothetical protein [Acetatifactor sp.]